MNRTMGIILVTARGDVRNDGANLIDSPCQVFDGAMTSARGSVRLDTARLGVDAFRAGWAAQIGEASALPAFRAEATAGARVRGRAYRVGDAVVTDFATATPVRVDATFPDTADLRLYVVHRGSYVLRHARESVPVAAGQFLLHRSTGLTGYEVAAGTEARVIGLPAGALATGARVTGPAAAAEVRLLLGHADLMRAGLADLSDAGVRAGRDALVELVRGVAQRFLDDREPRLTASLVQTARALADRLLTEPELTPAMLARRLSVSVRTLHRAFAATGEPVATYIRRRRLEAAHDALLAPGGWSVSAVAAHWQFADSSHFSRAFRRHYGQTPARYARDRRS
ncbi:helix-turn-helix domain-containing protein [Actinoplanes sp. NPDC049265]|uniref:helix-turn-helix domain-containing protein n=1 Tax=Actinoplanes sp. NPDC049265 TaxID=3363902 RepID=UPI00371784FB